MSNLTKLTRKIIDEPDAFVPEDVNQALDIILQDTKVNELQVAAFIVAARATRQDHTADFIAATVANLRKHSKPIHHDPTEKYVDIVGTGGDGHNTFNVSTTSAIVAAGTGCVKVAKHGGPASTSNSGASDLMACLGVDLLKVNEATTSKLLKRNAFVYMSGPIFHPILARVKPIRKMLGIPTIFNLVGPLLNPARIGARVLGVYTPNLGHKYAQAAAKLFPGIPALVVCGFEGLDEISPEGHTRVWELDESGKIREYNISPSDFGLPSHPLSEVSSGTPEENAQLLQDLLDNKLPANHPIRDYVLMNTAALLYISRVVQNLKDGVELASESLLSGRAKAALESFTSSVRNL